MVDWIVLGLIGAAAIFGLIRGIVSQIMALAGLVAAYLLAPTWGPRFGGLVQAQLGCSRFMAEKASILMVGLVIYLGVRLLGYGVEKLVVKRVKSFERLNRIGGGVMGAVKSVLMIAIVFFFVALLPRQTLKERAPRVLDSRTYQYAARFNPMGEASVLDRMRRFRSAVSDPRQREQLEKNQKVDELLSRYQLKSALKDKRFVRSLKEGDYDDLKKNDAVEKMMRDDELVNLLDQLEQRTPG